MLKSIQIQGQRYFHTVSTCHKNYGKRDVKIAESLTNIYATKNEVQELKSVHNEIVGYLTNLPQFTEVTPVCDLYKNILEYNVEQINGSKMISIYKDLSDKEALTSENIKKANVLAWCYEVLIGFGLMLDDMTHGSPIRRGKLPWYKLNDVGLQAINHAMMLENSLYLVLLQYFRDNSICSSIMNVFPETVFTIFSGQSFRETFFRNGRPQLELYTFERFNTLAYIETGYLLTRFPFILASYLAGEHTAAFELHADFLGKKLGALTLANNDFVGWISNRIAAEKADADVVNGKCNWLVTTALQKATPAQKHILERHYGGAGVEAELAIRNLYQELELSNEYEVYERRLLTECFDYADKVPDKKHRTAILNFLSKTSKYHKFTKEFCNEEGSNSISYC